MEARAQKPNAGYVEDMTRPSMGETWFCTHTHTPCFQLLMALPVGGEIPQDEDDESRVDTAMVRQMHLSSNMFGQGLGL